MIEALHDNLLCSAWIIRSLHFGHLHRLASNFKTPLIQNCWKLEQFEISEESDNLQSHKWAQFLTRLTDLIIIIFLNASKDSRSFKFENCCCCDDFPPFLNLSNSWCLKIHVYGTIKQSSFVSLTTLVYENHYDNWSVRLRHIEKEKFLWTRWTVNHRSFLLPYGNLRTKQILIGIFPRSAIKSLLFLFHKNLNKSCKSIKN